MITVRDTHATATVAVAYCGFCGDELTGRAGQQWCSKRCRQRGLETDPRRSRGSQSRGPLCGRLRLPGLRYLLPGRTKMSRLQPVVPSDRTRWNVPALR